jgi:superfamily II DNA or RNA helicase
MDSDDDDDGCLPFSFCKSNAPPKKRRAQPSLPTPKKKAVKRGIEHGPCVDPVMTAIPQNKSVKFLAQDYGEVMLDDKYFTEELQELLTVRAPDNGHGDEQDSYPIFTKYPKGFERGTWIGIPPAFAAAAFPNATIRWQPILAQGQGPTFTGSLYPWQEVAVAAMLKHLTEHRSHQGIINASCGCGKTVLGLKLGALLGGPVLWLSPAKLVAQTVERAKQFYGPGTRVGILQQKHRPAPDCHICVASLSTVTRLTDTDFLRRYSTVVIDEVHYSPCRTFARALTIAAHGRYRIGLTATMIRSTGGQDAIHYLAGGVVYRAKKHIHAVVKMYHYRVPATFKVQNNRYTKKPDWTKAVSDLVKDEERTRLHAAVLKRVAAENDFSIMHLGTRTQYLKDLHGLLGDKIAGIVTGSTPKARREVEQKKDVALTAYNIGKDGMDEERCGALGLGLPCNQIGALLQAVGRTDRDPTGEAKRLPSLILDLVDDHWLFRSSQAIHRKHWEEEGYTIEDIQLNAP